MAEKKNVVIFELAPDLGLKPLELVKQLKESGLKFDTNVKSHMDEVSEADAEKIKSYFLNKKRPAEQVEKKVVVKKKTDEPKKAAPKIAKKHQEPKEEKKEESQQTKIITRKKKVEVEEVPVPQEPEIVLSAPSVPIQVQVEEQQPKPVEKQVEKTEEKIEDKPAEKPQQPAEPRRDKPRIVDTSRPSDNRPSSSRPPYPPRPGDRPSSSRPPYPPRPGGGGARPKTSVTLTPPPAHSHYRTYEKKKETHIDEDKKKGKTSLRKDGKFEVVVDVNEVKTIGPVRTPVSYTHLTLPTKRIV